MSTIKDRNGTNLTKAEGIKRWQEYTEELNQNGLNDLDNHDSSDILEYEAKWALGSVTERS